MLNATQQKGLGASEDSGPIRTLEVRWWSCELVADKSPQGFFTLATQRVASGPATSSSPRNLLEKQELKPAFQTY